MRIFVRTMSGRRIPFDLGSSARIETLKEGIRQEEGIPMNLQRLLFAGKLLESGTLQDYNVCKNATIHLCPSFPRLGSGKYNDEWWENYRSAAQGDTKVGPLVDKDGSMTQCLALTALACNADPTIPKGLFEQPRFLSREKYGEILDAGLGAAIQMFEKSATSGGSGGPFVVHPYVPFPSFEEWWKLKENAWRLSFAFIDSIGGAVLLYGDPSYLHEYISSWFHSELFAQLSLLLDASAGKHVRAYGSSQIILPNGVHKEPDFLFQAVLAQHLPPQFVGEVAYGNESYAVLKEELVQHTLVGGAKIAYGVKVDLPKDPEVAGGFKKIKLRFLERRQGETHFRTEVDFSPLDEEKEESPTECVIEFPLSCLFEGTTVNIQLMTGSVKFNLHELQEHILDLLKNTKANFDPIIRSLQDVHTKSLQELLPEIPLWVKNPDYDRAICKIIRDTAKPYIEEYGTKYRLQSSLRERDRAVSKMENILVAVKAFGLRATVQVVDLQVFATARVTLKLLAPAFPCFCKIIVSLMEKPHVDFGLKLLGGDLMAIPGLYAFVQDLIKDKVSEIVAKKPVGMLEVKVVKATGLKKKNLMRKSDPYERPLGMQVVPLKATVPGETKTVTLALVKSMRSSKSKASGSTYNRTQPSRRIRIFLLRTRTLMASRKLPKAPPKAVVARCDAEDLEGKHHTNPYVKLTFRGEQKKAKAIKKNQDPRWDQEFQHRLPELPVEDRLRVEVISTAMGIGVHLCVSLDFFYQIVETYQLIDSKNGKIHDMEWRAS
ncbi:hypothetical protein SELMODRAFT_403728 [Selaginella moellendorffii]|uniref:Uncharacterized protein n=1 Tax=Selaginella moellendorffii TaxID=88036 RepID=D8QSB9_SELML|nr:hypothetical protein SELMODRAFT_403728 [Selaginella moellendorffii]